MPMTDEEYAAYKKRKADEAAASKAARDKAYNAARESESRGSAAKSASAVEEAPTKASAPVRTPAPIASLDANIRQKWINETANGETTLTYPEYVYKYRDQLPR